MKHGNIKLFLGLVIFLFSLALAYFTASYLSDNHYFDYWGAIAIFGGAYVLIGIAISSVFPVSLGFLFGADVLLLHLLLQYYGDWANQVKAGITGIILVILYVAAAFGMQDREQVVSEASVYHPASVPPSTPPPAA